MDEENRAPSQHVPTKRRTISVSRVPLLPSRRRSLRYNNRTWYLGKLQVTHNANLLDRHYSLRRLYQALTADSGSNRGNRRPNRNVGSNTAPFSVSRTGTMTPQATTRDRVDHQTEKEMREWHLIGAEKWKGRAGLALVAVSCWTRSSRSRTRDSTSPRPGA